MAKHWRVVKNDPLTMRYARYPHEHATPAEYGKSIEGPLVDDSNDSWLGWFAVAVSIVSICAVVAIVIVEEGLMR